MSGFLSWVGGVPDPLVYVVLAAGAALENIVPAVPADTFVAVGGLLAGADILDAWLVALVTWIANVVTAVAVYRIAYAHGAGFFERGWGRHLLRPHQMERVARFYGRWGLPAIFLSRFLPGFRAVVPVFAGATRQRALHVVPPVAIASGLWYGGLVRLGLWAGQNLDVLAAALDRLNVTLALIAGAFAVVLVVWWVGTRGHPDE